jgi:hypothetical protein
MSLSNINNIGELPSIPSRGELYIPQVISRKQQEQSQQAQAIKSTNESTKLLAEFQRANLASEFANHLLSKINQFDADLNSDLEVGLKLVSFGQTITFHVSGIGFYNPSLVVFAGLTDDGNRVELVQHVSQISFVLIALPKLNPEQPKRKIGFVQEST